MQHKNESMTDLGAIKIHKNAIASITSIAAAEIEGVKRVGVLREIEELAVVPTVRGA